MPPIYPPNPTNVPPVAPPSPYITGPTGTPNPYQHVAPHNAGGWQFPDYQALLNQWLAPYQQQYDAANQQALAGLNTQEQLAQNRFNQGDTSTMARLKGAHEDMVQHITNSLAARGILHSGQLGFENKREDLAFKRANYDASNQLLDYLSNLQQQYLSGQQSAMAGLNDQQLSIAEQLAQIYQPTYQDPNSYQAALGGGPWGNRE